MSPELSLEGQAELHEAREVEDAVGFSKGVLYRVQHHAKSRHSVDISVMVV